MRSRLSLWTPVVAYMAMIFWFSSQSVLPELPGSLSFYEAHLAAYFGLGALMARALAGGMRRVRWPAVALAALLSSLYGVTDEVHQRFVPGRTFDVYDMAADAAGSAIGAMTIGAWSIITRVSET